MKIVQAVMCGGAGTRLWPVSRQERPKQLHALVSSQSMLAATIARGAGIDGLDLADTILITNARYADETLLEAQRAGVAQPTILLEPTARNTAPAAALACLAALEKDPDAVVLLLPADHHIADLNAYRAAILLGAAQAAEGALVTLGIRPSGPHTGYGYIEGGVETVPGAQQVTRFVEKPSLARATEMVQSGRFQWNAGIFLFRADFLLAELAKYEPRALDAPRRAYAAAKRHGPFVILPESPWDETLSISIDYAVAERTARAVTVPADLGWSDVGSWATLWEIGDKDAHGNVVAGAAELIAVENCYVRAESRQVALVGVQDLVVVETADAVLILPRERAQDVKLIVGRMAAAKAT
jgi:mannose-1-phosphate guanylyltransferase/mannose-6-phosphate isomerase